MDKLFHNLVLTLNSRCGLSLQVFFDPLKNAYAHPWHAFDSARTDVGSRIPSVVFLREKINSSAMRKLSDYKTIVRKNNLFTKSVGKWRDLNTMTINEVTRANRECSQRT